MSYKEYTVRVHDNGDIVWYMPNSTIRHREDGPAIEHKDGYRAWYQFDKWHREDGPAIIYPSGKQAWYIDGIPMSEEEFNNRNKPSCDGKVVEIDGKKYQLKEVK